VKGARSLNLTSLVRYDLNLTLGCHRFDYLAPHPVLDPICLPMDLFQWDRTVKIQTNSACWFSTKQTPGIIWQSRWYLYRSRIIYPMNKPVFINFWYALVNFSRQH